MEAVVVLAGEFIAGIRIKSVLDRADIVIAADGGAANLQRAGFVPDVLIGDLDSIPEVLLDELGGMIPEICRLPPRKDQTDAELALAAALARGATDITVLGALGGPRIDHEMANMLYLVGPMTDNRKVRLLTEFVEVWGIRDGRRVFAAEVGDTVSIIPVSDTVSAVSTDGLEWELEAATLTLGSARTVSNTAVSNEVSVAVGTGTVILVHHFGNSP